MSDPFIRTSPAARSALVRGIDRMARLLRLTLGPTARTVMLAPVSGSGPPTMLDHAARVARQMIEIGDPFEDMGAMIVREVAITVAEQAGDGAATAAVLTQALVQAAEPYIAAGGNPMLVSRGIAQGAEAVRAVLCRQACAIDLPEEVARVAEGVVKDRRLAAMIGEILDSVGPDGAVLLEDVARRETSHDYVDGMRWSEGYVSPAVVKDGQTTARVVNPRIFATDYVLRDARQVLPAVNACVEAGERRLLVIAPEIRDAALGLLLLNRERGVLDDVIAVRAPGLGVQRAAILEDIAVVTGGRCLLQQRHDALAQVTIDDLGRARQAWATRTAFGIVGGRGSKPAIRQRIIEAKAELRTVAMDTYERNKIRERIGKLAGTTAIVYVGSPQPGQQEELRRVIEAGVTAARAALQDGVVSGGGAAYIACLPALDTVSCHGDEGVGVRILARALTAPMRAIAENAGLDPGPIVQEALERGAECVYDVVRRQWVAAVDAGPTDPLPVTLAALDASVSAARMAITTDVLIARSARRR